MSSSIIEKIRQFHEDIEIREKVALKLISERKKKKTKFRPLYDHAIQEELLGIQEASQKLLTMYEDGDQLRENEIEILGGIKPFASSSNLINTSSENYNSSGNPDDNRMIWQNFYDQLKYIKDSNKIQSSIANSYDNNTGCSDLSKDIAALAADSIERRNVSQLFSTDEALGSRVDMSSHYMCFINLPKIRREREMQFRATELSRLRKKLLPKKNENDSAVNIEEELEDISQTIQFQEIDYITYLKVFDQFSTISRYCKYQDSNYMDYIKSLLSYIRGFLQRINPLANHDKLESHLKSEFETNWYAKKIPGWEEFTHNLPYYAIASNRLLATEATYKSHTESAKYQKLLSKLEKEPIDVQNKKIEDSEKHDLEIAQTEYLVQRYKDIISGIIQKTIEYMQKKQSRTLRELELESYDSDSDDNDGTFNNLNKPLGDMESDSDSGDDDKPVYNPLNLPLGWDGKPIPFWLYKLHGLGVEFKCEICGNYSYWGRRAFERHFQEWRHAFGMRCLKIPNTVHFKEITKIEDAIMLYEQLKKDAEFQTFKMDTDVECEDFEGNVMSSRAYEDLRRQGLL